MAEASKKVQQLINDNPVVVFSKSYCPYCKETKRALQSMGANFEAFELDQASDGGALQDAIEELTGQRTVPNTFILQKSIGGNSDLQGLRSSGKLKALLTDAGALSA
ncbi:putative glutaredoxin Grx1 [Ilyonectria robusta]|uniref:putative glutaredoxin Grx1 n=1 Tax=Ilyonectria robusta TaxID=1079257 RepID=UPI001E8DEE7B|nr:putative glutaredoxin Grx1 [Ilyonectria robusta]KAH6975273.1 putative glutaredoxin Grx1 [Ilyonectria sp. MPI-CAGE-AT-0026]KAH8685192.1 putative glutaredoxin Grx1 [Ilyonectria robusta]